MKFSMFFCLAVVVFAAQAGATWGMKYQVNDGSGWTSQLTVNVATGPKSIDFRVIGYHDGATELVINPSDGYSPTGLAYAPRRFTGTSVFENLSVSAFGDAISNLRRTTSHGNDILFEQHPSGTSTVLGRVGDAKSFASQLPPPGTPPVVRLEQVFFTGTLLVGNGTQASLNRVILMRLNSGGPTSGADRNSPILFDGPPDSIYGLPTIGVSLTPRTDVNATITVIPSPAASAMAVLVGSFGCRRRRRDVLLTRT